MTHPKIYAPPSSLDRAIAQVQAWLESHVVELLGESETHGRLLQTHLQSGKVRGPMVHDAHIAAICQGQGVSEFLSADRGFNRFASLTTRNPLLD